MSDKQKPTHNIAITEKFEINGEEKRKSTYIGSAWLHKKGVISCQLKPNIALTGRFVLFEITEDDKQ